MIMCAAAYSYGIVEYAVTWVVDTQMYFDEVDRIQLVGRENVLYFFFLIKKLIFGRSAADSGLSL
jgi:hypothetical protein